VFLTPELGSATDDELRQKVGRLLACLTQYYCAQQRDHTNIRRKLMQSLIASTIQHHSRSRGIKVERINFL
jgi:hypothetical protein